MTHWTRHHCHHSWTFLKSLSPDPPKFAARRSQSDSAVRHVQIHRHLPDFLFHCPRLHRSLPQLSPHWKSIHKICAIEASLTLSSSVSAGEQLLLHFHPVHFLQRRPKCCLPFFPCLCYFHLRCSVSVLGWHSWTTRPTPPVPPSTSSEHSYHHRPLHLP